MRYYYLIAAVLLLVSCARETGTRPMPVDLTRDHSCSVCGMIIVDFPGAKAQVHYHNGSFDLFCSTLDMFLFYLQPDRPAPIAAIYVNDIGKTSMEKPQGNWIDAKKAFYVYGGNIMGPMGEALVPFSAMKDADSYVEQHGGKIIRFDEVTTDLLKPRVQDSSGKETLPAGNSNTPIGRNSHFLREWIWQKTLT